MISLHGHKYDLGVAIECLRADSLFRNNCVHATLEICSAIVKGVQHPTFRQASLETSEDLDFAYIVKREHGRQVRRRLLNLDLPVYEEHFKLSCLLQDSEISSFEVERNGHEVLVDTTGNISYESFACSLHH